MTKIVLPGLSAFSGFAARGQAFGHRETRDARRPKGWTEELLEMLRADATNLDYLTRGFSRH